MGNGYDSALQMATSQVERELALYMKDEGDDYVSKRSDSISEAAQIYHVAFTDVAAALVGKQPPED
jgi:hypothetical protein